MRTTVSIRGMHCGACVRRLTEAFHTVPGVQSVRVSLDPPSAEFESDGPLPLDALDRAARSAGSYSVESEPVPVDTPPSLDHDAGHGPDERPESLYPLMLIVGFILGTTALATFVRGDGSVHTFLHDFMAGFFLVFSFFKLLDLRGFADAYQTYDIIAQRSRAWALAYPFVELGLGLAYLVRWQLIITNIITLVVMVIGSIGVVRALRRKTRIRCACLGTALNLPMTTVTLIEDLAMAAMALGALIWAG